MLHAGADTPSTSLYQDEPRFDIAVLGMPFDTAVSYRCVACALLPVCHAPPAMLTETHHPQTWCSLWAARHSCWQLSTDILSLL